MEKRSPLNTGKLFFFQVFLMVGQCEQMKIIDSCQFMEREVRTGSLTSKQLIKKDLHTSALRTGLLQKGKLGELAEELIR